jgi:hypothetical protein
VGVLDGEWEVERVSGALPPLGGVRKRIAGGRGVTTLGPLRFPFNVNGLELRYRLPPGLVDVLEPEGAGFLGRTRLFGRELGRFRLVKPR